MLRILPELTPPGNAVGLLLLIRALESALVIEGLTCQHACAGIGPWLEDSVFFAPVSDAAKSVEVIKAELAAVCLLIFCQIGILEEGCWRCVYPSPEVRLEWLLDTDRLDHASTQYCQALSRRADTLLKWLKPLLLKRRQEGDKG
jgi:hypothetical protein